MKGFFTRLLSAFVLTACLAFSAQAAPVPATHYGPVKTYNDAMTLIGYLVINGQPAPARSEIACYDKDNVLVGASGVDVANGSSFSMAISGPANGPYRFVAYHPKAGEIDGGHLTFAAFDGKIEPPGLIPPALKLEYQSLGFYGVRVEATTAFSLR